MNRLSRSEMGLAVRSANRCRTVHEPCDFDVAIERRSIPRQRKIAPLGQRPPGAAQPIDRAAGVAVAAARPNGAETPLVRRSARRSPSGGFFKRLLQPGPERARVQPIGLRLGQHGEQRIDAGLDRPFAQQFGAEAVDRVDVRFLERLEREIEARGRVTERPGAPRLERLAQAQLQLSGRLLRERHGDDLESSSRVPSRARAGCG